MNTQSPPVVDNPLFLLDYDGTLAPIRQEPSEAFPHPEVPGLLHSLSNVHPIWIVTGRNLRDLQELLPVKLAAIGLHGLQKGKIGGSVKVILSEQEQRDLYMMRNVLPDIPETRVEDKESTFAVHYRGAIQEGAVIEALNTWLEDLPLSLSAIWGKKVLELKPKGVSKGIAIQDIVKRFSTCRPIYIGDDTTDETAFEWLHELNDDTAITIKVGPGTTCARYRLRGVDEVVSYLKLYSMP